MDLIETISTPGQGLTNSLDGSIEIEEGLGRIIANRRTLLGRSPALGTEGLFVTKEGFDVLTEADLENYIFNSNQNVLKFVDSLTVTLPTYNISNVSGWGQFNVAIPPSASIAHGATTNPIIFCFILATGGGGLTSVALPSIDQQVVSGAFVSRVIGFDVDTTNVNFYDRTVVNGAYSTPAAPLNIRIHVFQESTDTSN